MNTRTMRNPAYFVGKVLRSTNWIIPTGFACCPMTGQLRPVPAIVGGGNPAMPVIAEDDSDDAPEASPPDEEIASIVACIREQQGIAENAAAAIYSMKDRLEALLAARGDNWSDEDGYARLIAPSTRTNYSKDGLDALLLADPVKYGWLAQYRKQSTLAARVTVK